MVGDGWCRASAQEVVPLRGRVKKVEISSSRKAHKAGRLS